MMNNLKLLKYREIIPSYPKSIRRSEIARRMNIHRSTVTRDIRMLEQFGLKIIEDANGKLSLAERRKMTVSDYLVCGMKLPAIGNPAPVPENTYCALEGIPITTGYPIWDIVPEAAGEFLEMLHGNVSGYLSENAARAFKGTWNMGSWLIFEDGTGYHPLISREEAKKQNRPCWSNLARKVWQDRNGQGVLCILTTDVKKRVWPRARVGILGTTTPVYLHDPEQNLSGVVIIDWKNMLEKLDFVEELLNSGFNKISIRRSLLSDLKTTQSVGLAKTIDYENKLSALRARPEFQFAYVISQKEKNETQFDFCSTVINRTDSNQSP